MKAERGKSLQRIRDVLEELHKNFDDKYEVTGEPGFESRLEPDPEELLIVAAANLMYVVADSADSIAKSLGSLSASATSIANTANLWRRNTGR